MDEFNNENANYNVKDESIIFSISELLEIIRIAEQSSEINTNSILRILYMLKSQLLDTDISESDIYEFNVKDMNLSFLFLLRYALKMDEGEQLIQLVLQILSKLLSHKTYDYTEFNAQENIILVDKCGSGLSSPEDLFSFYNSLIKDNRTAMVHLLKLKIYNRIFKFTFKYNIIPTEDTVFNYGCSIVLYFLQPDNIVLIEEHSSIRIQDIYKRIVTVFNNTIENKEYFTNCELLLLKTLLSFGKTYADVCKLNRYNLMKSFWISNREGKLLISTIMLDLLADFDLFLCEKWNWSPLLQGINNASSDDLMLILDLVLFATKKFSSFIKYIFSGDLFYNLMEWFSDGPISVKSKILDIVVEIIKKDNYKCANEVFRNKFLLILLDALSSNVVEIQKQVLGLIYYLLYTLQEAPSVHKAFSDEMYVKNIHDKIEEILSGTSDVYIQNTICNIKGVL